MKARLKEDIGKLFRFPGWRSAIKSVPNFTVGKVYKIGLFTSGSYEETDIVDDLGRSLFWPLLKEWADWVEVTAKSPASGCVCGGAKLGYPRGPLHSRWCGEFDDTPPVRPETHEELVARVRAARKTPRI